MPTVWIVVAALAAALASAVPASAGPDCTDVAVSTRYCRTPGHSQIVTSPNPALTNPYPGWGYRGIGVGVIGGGLWIGF